MAKKKMIVLPRTKKISESGVELNGKKMDFHQGKALWMRDEGEARELQAKYPRDIAVTLDQQYTWHANNEQGNGTRMDNIHNYTFQGVDYKSRGGGERVKVKTDDGFTYVSREVAEEEGYEIIPQRREKRRKGAEVKDGI